MGYDSRSRFEIESNVAGQPLVIRDVGPWDRFLSVTNDAENVVQRIVSVGALRDGRELHYYDSEGELSRLLVDNGVFAGFAPIRNEVP